MTFEIMVSMKTKIAYFIFAFGLLQFAFTNKATAQGRPGIVMLAEVFEGDTFPVKYLPYLTVVEEKRFVSDYERRKWKALQKNVREMTTTQGRILVKLIDRETTQTSYEIVKEFRGGFTAFFWQGLGKMFGQDLKSAYDPTGEDAQIEQIVLLIEAGVI
jgi:hypothetical protein